MCYKPKNIDTVSEIFSQEKIYVLFQYLISHLLSIVLTVKSILRGLAGSSGDKFGKGHKSSSGDCLKTVQYYLV